MSDEPSVFRLNKLMAERGLCSRREADKLIAAGHVLLNGKDVAQVGQKVSRDTSIKLLDEANAFLEDRFTIVMNKPVGYVSNLPQDGQKQASDLLLKENLYGELSSDVLDRVLTHKNDYAIAGRLDRASRGLLVLTNDGRMVKHITQTKRCKKTYLVTLQQDVSREQINRLNEMRKLGPWQLLPMQVKGIGRRKLQFVLQEGKKHQIREVCKAVDVRVRDLLRIKVGPIELHPLDSGSWRILTADECQMILGKQCP